MSGLLLSLLLSAGARPAAARATPRPEYLVEDAHYAEEARELLAQAAKR